MYSVHVNKVCIVKQKVTTQICIQASYNWFSFYQPDILKVSDQYCFGFQLFEWQTDIFDFKDTFKISQKQNKFICALFKIIPNNTD